MADKAWKASERRIAAFFGSKRNIGSGSLGRSERSTSDSIHPGLYIEAKQRAIHTTQTLYDDTRTRARKEKKVPVVCLATKHRPGFLVVVHSDDLDAFIAEYLKGKIDAVPNE